MAKREQKERDARDKEIEDAIKTSMGKNGKATAEEETSVMKAYSLAIAKQAESSEPDEPTNYGTQVEKQELAEKEDAPYSVEKNEEESDLSKLLASAT